AAHVVAEFGITRADEQAIAHIAFGAVVADLGVTQPIPRLLLDVRGAAFDEPILAIGAEPSALHAEGDVIGIAEAVAGISAPAESVIGSDLDAARVSFG